jgi:hypothetical protein
VLAEDVFAGVAGLVEKSLLIKHEGASVARYRMLETIRQYGSVQLGGEKELVVRTCSTSTSTPPLPGPATPQTDWTAYLAARGKASRAFARARGWFSPGSRRS